MDPTNHGAGEYGHDSEELAPARLSREALTPDFGQHTPMVARTVQLVSGDFLLTVNPVDGSEIEPCPPGEHPPPPVKYTAAERAERERGARPPVPPGPASAPLLPLIQRQEERERLVHLVARGRSVRLTGPAGSGRTALLDAVAEDCADLAPDGVVRLTGYRRTASDLLFDLFSAVYKCELHRPDDAVMATLVREIGAVVVVDDLELGGGALDELLDATPECAFLLSATPDVPAPSPETHLEEIFLAGLDRVGSVQLLESCVGRALTEDESNWAGDLWFESEGLPIRFMQAGALLRQRDELRADPDAFDEFGYYEDAPVDAPLDVEDVQDVPLPSLAEGAAPAELLASRLSESARVTLRFAVALGGEVPHQAHLPALVGDTHADAALAELAGCSLLSPVGSRYRLAAGMQNQLLDAGYGSDAEERALTAARHYAWWAGHPSVTPERVTAEADAVLAALTALVPVTTTTDGAEQSAAVMLARAAAPAFAAGLDWSAWERALRAGAEASRMSGEVTDQAYFHHELGILALCARQLDRSRAELEASIGLRGALADKRGTVAGRRALALVADRSGGTPPGGRTAAGEEVPDARHEESASPPGGVPSFLELPPADPSPVLTYRPPAPAGKDGSARRLLLTAGRRNLAAASAGVVLAAVLGTVVTLGATSDSSNGNAPSDRVGVNPSASAGGGEGGLGADAPKRDDGTGSTARPLDPGQDGILGTSDDPEPPPSDDEATPGETDDEGGVSAKPSESGKPSSPKPSVSKPPTTEEPPPTTEEPPPPTTEEPPPPTTEEPPPPTTEEPPPLPPTDDPEPPATASGPADPVTSDPPPADPVESTSVAPSDAGTSSVI
ncbi:ATP-binding protein [Streptomyces cavernae]|uniref:ATP-binding protein n=1 Tax=Streptomyces cavernae TaxID=2259034 RepID=UPI000FEBD420|nr:ATP-binding protein [Streptomyces cavernae]